LLVPSAISVVLDELDRRDDDLRLHLLGYGASPISDSLLVRAMDRFECRFVQFYGATETTGAITCLEPGDHRVDGPHLRSCGRPAPGVELRIVDPTSSAVADVGQVGEVCVRSKQVMSGYWRRPEASATVIDAEGWFHTGDLGYCDVDGYLYIHDRLKDMIVTGGENVYAAEVENVLEGHRAVAEVAVIGIPSERWGEQVHALVVRRPGQDVDEAVLVAYTRETLAGYKCPKSVDFVESLPRNPSGKVLRRELRAPFWEAHDRSIG
jgi:acyl-CoA synthetase (AMP-forming)/AMP-acid ligase II